MDELWELYSRIISEKGLNLQYDEKAETAFYNPETQFITIPIFNFVDEETTQMIVSHEIAHAKFSLYSQEELIEYSNKFQDLFNLFKSPEKEEEKKPTPCNPSEEKKEEEKKEQSPTKGIANEFIQHNKLRLQ